MGQSIVDWTVLTDDVLEVCEQQSAKVARAFTGIIEYEDLLQEAFIYVATHPAEVKGYVADERLGYLAKRVWSRLMDHARPKARNRPLSLDELADRWAE